MPGATGKIVVRQASRFRMFLAALCGVIAIGLILASVLTVWFTQSLLDTNKYTQTVAPIILDKNVQEFLATKATDTLLNAAPPEQVAAVVLKPEQVAGKTPEQLKAESTKVVNDAVLTLVGSEQFQEFWETNNKTIHAQLVSQLKGNTDTLTIDMTPLLSGLVKQAESSELGALVEGQNIQIPTDAAKVSLTGGPLDQVRKYYQMLQTATIVMVVLALLAALACVALSVQHMRTIRRVLIGLGVLSLIGALILQAPSIVMYVSKSAEQLAAASFVRILFHDLQFMLLVIGAASIAAAIISKIVSVALKRA